MPNRLLVLLQCPRHRSIEVPEKHSPSWHVSYRKFNLLDIIVHDFRVTGGGGVQSHDRDGLQVCVSDRSRYSRRGAADHKHFKTLVQQ
jgi:hypothetical protein